MSESFHPLAQNEFPKLDAFELDPHLYDGARLVLGETVFFVFGRKKGAIGVHRLSQGIRLTWPKWTSRFAFNVPPITFIETDWGLGGGSLGSYTLAVHLRGEYDEASSRYLESILGWPRQRTGSAYIEQQFASFDDPMQAYVTDQVAHELGHVFFLHGIVDVKNEAEVWFGLGLGLVYDRLIWHEIFGVASPVFEAFSIVWKERFATNSVIDQRLVNPDITQDSEYGLVRLQTYGHAKAVAYLSSVRERLGPERFDEYVRSYLSKRLGATIGYDDFLESLSTDDMTIVRELETRFVVR
jgi:hypothetical protein